MEQLDWLVNYKMAESMKSAKENLWTKSSEVFMWYKTTVEHSKILSNNYPNLFKIVEKVSKVIESGSGIPRMEFRIDSSSDSGEKLAGYLAVSMALSVARFYAEFSLSGWVNKDVLSILDKDRFYEFDCDGMKITQSLRWTNVLIVRLDDVKYMTKHDAWRYMNAVSMLRSARSTLKVMDVYLWNAKAFENHEELLKLYEDSFQSAIDPIS